MPVEEQLNIDKKQFNIFQNIDKIYKFFFHRLILNHLNLNDILFINSINCLTYRNIVNKNNKSILYRCPTIKERTSCFNYYIKNIIDVMQPKIIILAGNIAIKMINEDKSMLKNRGEWIKYNNYPCLITYSPYYLYNLKQQDNEFISKEKILELLKDFYKDIDLIKIVYKKHYKDNNLLLDI